MPLVNVLSAVIFAVGEGMTLSTETSTARRVARLALIYAGALTCGYIADRLQVPLPWMIGSILFSAAFRLSGQEMDIPGRTRQVGQILVASSVGLAFTPAAVSAMGSLLLPMLAAALLTIVFGFAIGAFIKMAAKVDVITATLAAVPTGPVESVVLANKHGVDPGPVIFAQIFRIMALVCLVPPIIVALDGTISDPSSVLSNVVWTPGGALLLVAAGVGGAFLARVLRISNPFFVGSLAGAALVAAFDLPVTALPYPVLVVAQTFLGVWLGAAFDRDLLRRAKGFISIAVLAAFMMAGLCAILGLLLSYLTGVSWQVMVLATAPGSATEMALTAKILNEGLAIVTAFHVLRIFIILPFAPLIIGTTAKVAAYWERRTKPADERAG